MVLALILALAQAASGVTGVVKDSNGQVIVGATVAVRTPSGGLQQTVTDGEGRFLIAQAAGRRRHAGGARAGLRRRATAADARRDRGRARAGVGARNRDGDAPPAPSSGSATCPASVNVVTSENIKASPAVVADDVLRQVPTFSLFRRTSSLARSPPRRACRCAASARAARAARSSCSTACRSTIRSAAGSTGRACRSSASTGSRSPKARPRACTATTRWAASSTSSPAGPRARTLELQTQYGNRSSPKVDFFASDRWNKVGVAVEGSAFNTDGFPIVAPRERGPIDNNADVDYRNLTAKVEFDAADRAAHLPAGRLFHREPHQRQGRRGQRHRWTTVQRRRPARCRTTATCRRASSSTGSGRTSTSWPSPTRPRRATSSAWPPIRRVPTNGVGGMVQWTKVLGSTQVLSAGTDWRWVDGDSQEDAYVAAVPTVITGVTQRGDAVGAAHLGRHAAEPGRVRAGHLHARRRSWCVTLSARVDHWRNYDGHNLETTVATGLPTANNGRRCPTEPTRSSARAWRRSTTSRIA